MAITVMVIIKRINKSHVTSRYIIALLAYLIVPTIALAGDWQFKPNFSLDETFTDNVELSTENTTSSYVTQTIVGVDMEYDSNLTNFHWSGNQIYALYSHNSELNDSFRTLNATGEHTLWTAGPVLTASASVTNISPNDATNATADLISGGTIEQKYYSSGLMYNFSNSSYSISSSINYNITRTEDNIGDNNGLTVQFDTQNGNNARNLYWQLNSSFTKRKQDSTSNTGENYTVEALIGAITEWNFNPFIRYYDESAKGTAGNQNLNTTSSWGPGIRWLATPHIIIDLSYNFVADETISDNYLDTSIQWEPSERTSLTLGYSQRFFGESYNFNLSHKIKRLTNSISYDETLKIFDRNTYQELTPGVPVLVESTEFSLNKRFSWLSQLQLSKTSFDINLSGNERTSLVSDIVDSTFDASINMVRTISPKSNFTLSASFNRYLYDQDNPLGSRQEDYYRIISTSFKRDLASSLYYNLSVQHVNRNSTISRFSYNEVRAIINITKEF